MADLRPRRIAELIAPYRVAPGRKVRLPRDYPTDAPGRFGRGDAREARAALESGTELLSEYQERLAAQDTYGVLVIVQGIDASGKDGTIRHVMSGINPQGVEVNSFKIPSDEDQDHDYLWRYARQLPSRGSIGIFNRSYYEEVLVVRVHPELLQFEKLPARSRRGDIWRRRFREINDWEHYLSDQGFKIVKLFLNLSEDEQRRRFLDRIDQPEKNWKFSPADVKERAFWGGYQKAFSDMLSNTSTGWAPWYVIPADDKPYARMIASAAIAHALVELNPQYPKITAEQRAQLLLVRAELAGEEPAGPAAARDRGVAVGSVEAADAEASAGSDRSSDPEDAAGSGVGATTHRGRRRAKPRDKKRSKR